MKVLVTTTTFPRWKKDVTPEFVYRLSKGLKQRGLNICVLAPYFAKSKKKEIMNGMKIFRYKYFLENHQNLCYEYGILPAIKKHPWRILQLPTLLMFQLINTIRIIKKEKIDKIHAHWIIPQGFIATIIKKIYGTPFVVTTHGGDIFGAQNWLLKIIKKIVLKNADKITVVSNAIKDKIYYEIDPNLKINVIPMGVNLSNFSPNKYDKKIKINYNITDKLLLFVGRLTEKKGVSYLIKAMPDILKKFPKTKLLIIGYGQLESELKILSKKLNLENNIIFLGGIPNEKLPKYYATADIFIGPSIIAKSGDTEGFGLTFVEALGSKTAVISSDLPSISDIIIDGKTGLTTKQRDSKDIANTIIKLLSNKNLRDTLAKNGQAYVQKRFDWNIINKKYEEILR